MMRKVTDYSFEEIQSGLREARIHHGEMNDHVRILFAPHDITEHNFEQVCNIYSRPDLSAYRTAVIVETYSETLDKKLPMPSNREFRTPLGPIPVNDNLRNEFCDEEDDFFIHDEAFSKDMSLFQQLMMLQAGRGNTFNALSVQIADENPFIVRELVQVLAEVLASRSALLVFCCDLESSHREELERLKKLVANGLHSNLLNYLNSSESHIKGAAAFITGVLVAAKWDMRLNFTGGVNGNGGGGAGPLLTAYADRESVMY